MTKYLNFFESESGFTEAVGADELFYPNVSYTEDDDTVHWNLEQPVNPVQTPMLRMHFTTSTPGQEVKLRYANGSGYVITAMEIDGTPVNYASTYSIASPGNHTAVYQFASPAIPEGLFVSNTSAFTAFTSAEIISPVTEIGYQAFGACRGISSVTIPDSVTSIGYQAFAGTGLRHVTIPDSVTSMGNLCFNQCTEMRTAIIGSGITSSNFAASGNVITIIPASTFNECSSLQSVTLPDNLAAIGQEAFAGCSSLYDINIPSGVTEIYAWAFGGCTGLTAIYLHPETPPNTRLGWLPEYPHDNDCPIYVPAGSVDTYKEAWPGYASRIKAMYKITASLNDSSLGEVNLVKKTASEGDDVKFEVFVFDPDANQVSSVTVTDGNGSEVEYTDEGDGDYSFTMPTSDVTISVVIGPKQ